MKYMSSSLTYHMWKMWTNCTITSRKWRFHNKLKCLVIWQGWQFIKVWLDKNVNKLSADFLLARNSTRALRLITLRCWCLSVWMADKIHHKKIDYVAARVQCCCWNKHIFMIVHLYSFYQKIKSVWLDAQILYYTHGATAIFFLTYVFRSLCFSLHFFTFVDNLFQRR